jgi:hypothetical protein
MHVRWTGASEQVPLFYTCCAKYHLTDHNTPAPMGRGVDGIDAMA